MTTAASNLSLQPHPSSRRSGFPSEDPWPAPDVRDSRFTKIPSDSDDVDFLQFKRRRKRRRVERGGRRRILLSNSQAGSGRAVKQERRRQKRQLSQPWTWPENLRYSNNTRDWLSGRRRGGGGRGSRDDDDGGLYFLSGG